METHAVHFHDVFYHGNVHLYGRVVTMGNAMIEICALCNQSN